MMLTLRAIFAGVLSVAILLFACAHDELQPEDLGPPARVNDLRISFIDNTSIQLRFTAPGADGYQGTAHRYLIRRSQLPIDNSNWATATACPTVAPAAGGSRVEISVGGDFLTHNTFFALRSADEYDQLSELSNVVSSFEPRTILVSQTSEHADFFSISSAIAAAGDGDIILLDDDTYSNKDNLNLATAGKRLIIRSASGVSSKCIIDGSETFGAFRTEGGEDLVIEGLTIANCVADGGAALFVKGGLNPSTVTLRWCTIKANSGDAVFVESGGTINTSSCTFDNNRGSAALMAHDANINIKDSIFDGNASALVVQALDNAYSNRVSVRDCIFRFNDGAAIVRFEPFSQKPRFVGCLFDRNQTGFATEESANCMIDSCIFQANRRSALFVHDESQVAASHCSFRSNIGGAVSVYGDAYLTDCDFVGNSNAFGGGIRVGYTGNAHLTTCLFDSNVAVLSGGHIWLDTNAGITVDGCTFVFGEGIYCADDSRVHATRSIFAFGERAAFICANPDTVALSCCDVFGNEGGNWDACVNGQLGVDGNISADPLFCSLANFAVQEDSPCATATCGPMGFLPAGCSQTLQLIGRREHR